MNNIYVNDKDLPKCCLVCKMSCPEEERCVDGFTMDCDYCGSSGRPMNCPLKPLTDRLAEERKRVVQEIKKISSISAYCDNDNDFNYTYGEQYVIKDYELEQIERGDV